MERLLFQRWKIPIAIGWGAQQLALMLTGHCILVSNNFHFVVVATTLTICIVMGVKQAITCNQLVKIFFVL